MVKAELLLLSGARAQQLALEAVSTHARTQQAGLTFRGAAMEAVSLAGSARPAQAGRQGSQQHALAMR